MDCRVSGLNRHVPSVAQLVARAGFVYGAVGFSVTILARRSPVRERRADSNHPIDTQVRADSVGSRLVHSHERSHALRENALPRSGSSRFRCLSRASGSD